MDGEATTSMSSRAMRHTRQRHEVAALLDELPQFRTAQQLHALLVQRGAKVGLTTVYRTLQMLADAGEVDVTRLPDGDQMFRRCGQEEHHHHLVCRHCGATVEVSGPALERWANTAARERGFIDVTHTLEIFGTCSRCAKQ